MMFYFETKMYEAFHCFKNLCIMNKPVYNPGLVIKPAGWPHNLDNPLTWVTIHEYPSGEMFRNYNVILPSWHHVNTYKTKIFSLFF
jgi:hypothetical protein